MPELTKQEVKNEVRINNQLRAAGLLSGFVVKGFRTYASFKSVLEYYSKESKIDVQKFWQLNGSITSDMCDTVEMVLDNLKHE